MRKTVLLALTSFLLSGCAVTETKALNNPSSHLIATPQPVSLKLDDYTSSKVDTVLKHQTSPMDTGQRTNAISAFFMGTPYRANMLRGTDSMAEQLVIDFRGLDCFTYLEYVEALRKSSSESDFEKNLIETRYKKGTVGFLNRRHFFSDWANDKDHALADDLTSRISPHAVSIEKNLNAKSDGTAYLPGLPTIRRTITYIPSKFVDKEALSHLQTGDYIGLYTELPGLDVTHVGFFIRTDKGPVLRHASLKKGKVVDLPFLDYVSQKPGIVVYRPKTQAYPSPPLPTHPQRDGARSFPITP